MPLADMSSANRCASSACLKTCNDERQSRPHKHHQIHCSLSHFLIAESPSTEAGNSSRSVDPWSTTDLPVPY